MGGQCLICGRRLSVEKDPLSADCGGDCWGCVGEIDADSWGPSAHKVAEEIEAGWRNPDGSAKPPPTTLMRNIGSLALMLFGPWLVWLSYAHFVRPFLQDSLIEVALLGLSFLLGYLGAVCLGPPFNRWSDAWKLAGLATYAVVLTLSLPFIALISVCTTGDCL